MDIQCITKEDDFLSLWSIWDDLLRETPSNIVCLTHDWLKCWWHAYGHHSRLFILLARDKGKLVGIAPLRITRGRWRGFPVRMLAFMSNSCSPRSDFLLKEGNDTILNNILKYIYTYKGWDIAVFKNVPKESKSYKLMQQALREMNLSYVIKDSMHSPLISIDSDWETYFSLRSSKFRKQLRNKINRMHTLNYSIQEVSTFEEWKHVSPEVFKVSSNSWKAQGGTAMSSTKENLVFYENLSEIADQNRWLSVWLLRLNGQAIAIEYHLKYNGKVYTLVGDFDERYKEYSPGSFLEKHIIEHIFKSGYHEYDMCGGANEYKMKWASRVREHVTFIISHRGVYSNLLVFGERKALPLFKKFKNLVKQYCP